MNAPVPGDDDDPERLVPIGRVGRAHGLDGAFVVEDASDDPARFAIGASVHVDGAHASVVASRRVGKGRVAVRLDRPVTRGASLCIRQADLPPPGPDEWYAFQLVGLDVVEDGTGARIATVVGVYPGIANDNLELDDGTLVPLVDEAVPDIDLEVGIVRVRQGFLGPSGRAS